LSFIEKVIFKECFLKLLIPNHICDESWYWCVSVCFEPCFHPHFVVNFLNLTDRDVLSHSLVVSASRSISPDTPEPLPQLPLPLSFYQSSVTLRELQQEVVRKRRRKR